MDFQTLTRRELQSLCKLNKIPANITNVAMAEALQSLHTVVGIEEYLNVTRSETVEVFSPQTRCRSQKVKVTEPETMQNRTARRGSRLPPKEVEESKNDSLKTPLAVSRTTRKVRTECEETEVLVENKYGTRRSTRLTAKKATAKKEAVKIDSILDQGNSNAQVEDLCNSFDVVVIEEQVNKGSDEISNTLKISNSSEQGFDQRNGEQAEDDDEVTLKNLEVKVCEEASNSIEDDFNNSEVKDDQVCDLKPESDQVSKGLEVDLKQEFAMQEHNPIMLHENESSGVGADLGLVEDTLSAETNDSTVVSGMISDNTENPIDETIIITDVEEMSENTVDVTMTEEIEDFKPAVFTENKMTEKSESDPGLTESPLLSSDVTRHPAHTTPIKKATPFMSMTEEVEDRMFEVFTENSEKSDADLGQVTANPGHVTPLKNASAVVSDNNKENNVVEVKNIKKDENDKINANDMSIRQLKKLLKAMTLDSHNSKEESDDLGTKRTALQAVCENQMVVGGENEN